jgi:exopolyphosphatase/guanosine-5'-triphosphate,3'-diphosphate pyrophosphatase
MSVSTEPRAVLDVGSNTIRLLVARVKDGSVERVLDHSEFVRLGKRVDETGLLQPDRMAAGVATVKALAERARASGADTISAIATSAVRDARNGREFVDRVLRETGVKIEIISGEREAQLTFRGATLGVDTHGGVIVCDLGGGSAEVIAASEHGMLWSTSLPLGSGRLSERFVRNDPPTKDEVDAIRHYVEEKLGALPAATVASAVCTGGTASWMARLAGTEGSLQRIDLGEIDRIVQLLCSLPASEVSHRYEIPLERATVLPAGIPALDALARFYGVDHVLVSLSGIREGALLDADEAR